MQVPLAFAAHRFLRKRANFAAISILLVFPAHERCLAAIATWTGPGSVQAPTAGVFSSPGNWAGDVLPVFNETTDLIFDVGATAYTASNDLGALPVNSVRLNHDGDTNPELQLTGGTFTFASDGNEKPELTISSTRGNVRIGSDFVLGADLTLLRPNPTIFSFFVYIGSGTSGGNIDLGSHTLFVTRPSGLKFNAGGIRIGESGSTTRGVIEGTGKIVLEDLVNSFPATDLALQLGSQNTYSGGTEVKSGHLAVNGITTLLNGIVQSGPFGTGPVIMSGGVLRSAITRRAVYNEVIVNGSIRLGFSGLAGIIVAGPLRLNGTHEISVGDLSTPEGGVEISGPISEAIPGSGLTWSLEQTLKLTSLCTYTGATTVRFNTLEVNAPGSLRQSPMTLTESGGLSGDGETGAVTAEAGTTVNPGKGIGVLHTIGAARLNSGSNLTLQIDSPIAGLGYDQWDVHGTVDVTQSYLQIALGYDPVDFLDIFYLVKNDGADAVAGFFRKGDPNPADLPEGAHFFAGSQEFEITYTAEEGVGFAGTGNDIAIRALPEPSAFALLALCGGGLANRRRRKVLP